MKQADNKAGCLDTTSESFDPEATYWCDDECCNTTGKISIRKSVAAQSMVASLRGPDLVNTGSEALTYTIFDVAGHVLTSGKLASHSTFNIAQTGKGLRLFEVSGRNNRTMRSPVMCP